MKSKYKIIALGGLQENGKNTLILETEKTMILIDAGISNFTNKTLGIDYIIADYSYLEKNKKKFKAILISHGHFDQMGALYQILEKYDVPVYGSNYTIAFLKKNLDKKFFKNLKEITYSKVLIIDDVKVEPFTLSHAIFGNYGYLLAMQDEAIIYASDYNFDQIPSKFACTDIEKILTLKNKYKIKLFLTETVSIDNLGMSSGQQDYFPTLKREIESAPARVIFTLYSSNLHGMATIINLAEKYNKKIMIVGRDLLTYVNISRDLGYMKIPKDVFVKVNNINKVKDEDLFIVVAGLYDYPFMELNRVSLNNHNILKFKMTDKVIVASKPYDEIEDLAQEILDKVARNVGSISHAATNISAHAYQEDIKMMINLFEPEYIMPIKGEYRKFITLTKVAKLLGYTEEQVIIANNGEVIEQLNGSFVTTETLKLNNLLVNKDHDTNVNPIILKDREILSDNGYVTIILMFAKGTDKLVQKPVILSGGLIQFDDDEDILNGCLNIVEKEILSMDNNRQLVNKLKIKLSRYLNKKIGKTPMILPMRVEIDQQKLKEK